MGSTQVLIVLHVLWPQKPKKNFIFERIFGKKFLIEKKTQKTFFFFNFFLGAVLEEKILIVFAQGEQRGGKNKGLFFGQGVWPWSFGKKKKGGGPKTPH